MGESLDEALGKVVQERYGYLFPKPPVLPEPTHFSKVVQTNGPEALKRLILIRERFELGLTRNFLVAQLKGVNQRLTVIYEDLKSINSKTT